MSKVNKSTTVSTKVPTLARKPKGPKVAKVTDEVKNPTVAPTTVITTPEVTKTPVQPSETPKAPVQENVNGFVLHTKIGQSEARPGVLKIIKDMLAQATESTPVSKSEILAKLVASFDGRDSVKMTTTLNMQVPSGLKIEAGLIVASKQGSDGKKVYWLDVAKTVEFQNTHTKVKGKWVPKS